MKEIKHEDLVPGKMYYIESLATGENGKTICKYKRIGNFTGYDHGIYGCKFACFTNYRKPNDDTFDGYDLQLNSYWWKFYEVKKYNIQQNMETKVCDIKLQEITGDPYFRSGF